MIIKNIKITNFRCHNNYEMNFNNETSLIVGENGCGKTSVLEAIHIATRGISFRAADEAIIKRGADFYRIELEYVDGEKTIVTYSQTGKVEPPKLKTQEGQNSIAGLAKIQKKLYEAAPKEIGKRFLVGDKKAIRLPLKYRYPVILFIPDDLHILYSSPTKKRDFFDRIAGEIDESYGIILSRYNKALKQRNDLLKMLGDNRTNGDRDFASTSLFSWNVMLAKYGIEIRKIRMRTVKQINERLTETYRSIANTKDELAISYEVFEDKLLNETEYLARLERDTKKDLYIGHTSYGTHRDNYDFIFNGKSADTSASRGEVRSMILALKFIEAQLVFEKTGRRPIVLLDDVFSELDEMRQRALATNFKDNQVIITSVDEVRA